MSPEVLKKFNEWFEDWHDPNVGGIETLVEKIAARNAWEAAWTLGHAQGVYDTKQSRGEWGK